MADFSQFFSSSPFGSWAGPGQAPQPAQPQQQPVPPGVLDAIRRMLGIDEAPTTTQPNAAGKVPSPDFSVPPEGLRPRPSDAFVPNLGAAKSIAAGAVEPFGQLGRLMTGTSQDTVGDLAGAAMGLAPIGPPGAKAALEPTYSALGAAVRGAKQEAAHPEQWLGFLKNQPGVKAAEIEHVGLEPFLKGQQGPVSREAVGEFVQGKQPEIREVRKTAADRTPWRAPGTEPHVLPGGSNYGETLLTLPPKQNVIDQWRVTRPDGVSDGIFDGQQAAQRRAATIGGTVENVGQQTLEGGYKSSHWDEPNVLLHTRHNDRTIPGPNGEPMKSLHVEEIQSDWHQAGRKYGYKDNQPLTTRPATSNQWGEGVHEAVDGTGRVVGRGYGPEEALQAAKGMPSVPDAPFKTTWPDLALKRMLHRASTERNPDGSYKYDAMSWTPGEAQAARYDLSHHVDHIDHFKNEDGTYSVAAMKGHEQIWHDDRATPDVIEKNIGKEIAEKITGGEGKDIESNWQPGTRRLSGLDLKVGGEGMKSFYDKMLPDKANALVKKYGARVEKTNLTLTHDTSGTPINEHTYKNPAEAAKQPVHLLRITPALRAAAEKGFPTFAIGGAAVLGAQDRDN